MIKKDVIETIAQNLGFVPDNYYSAKEKMFGSCDGSNIISRGTIV